MGKQKSRKIKQQEYQTKYGGIPTDYYERLNYMCDKYNVSEKKFDEILSKKNEMLNNLYYKDLKVVLYEEPEGAVRPRTRIITPKNYMTEAIKNSAYVHVYSPNAADDSNYLKRLINDELIQLQEFIMTPCIITFDSYFPLPSTISVVDKFMAEIGLKRPGVKPDWDNIGKKYSDMYNSNIWLDDSYTITGIVNKYYSELPRVEIYLRYLNALYDKKMLDSVIKRKDYTGDPLDYLDTKGEVTHYKGGQ